MTAIKPRSLSLGLAFALCLSSYLAIRRITPDWDVSGQVSVPLVFLAVYGYGAIIHELALAHTAKDVANAKLAAAHTQLQEYSAQVEELSVIRERNRIAREIHDTLGHALTLLSVQLETATQLEARGDPRLHEELLQARQVAKACLTEVRHSVEALRPDEASGDSLQEQLRKLVAEFETTCRRDPDHARSGRGDPPAEPRSVPDALPLRAGGADQYSQACARHQGAAAPLHERWRGDRWN